MKAGDLVLWRGFDGRMRSGKVTSVIDGGLVCGVDPATGGQDCLGGFLGAQTGDVHPGPLRFIRDAVDNLVSGCRPSGERSQMTRDSRILAVSGEFAILRSTDVPLGVQRGSGTYVINAVPTEAEVANIVAQTYPFTKGPGAAGDMVRVRLADLKQVGWKTEDDPPKKRGRSKKEPDKPALRTAGRTVVTDVRPGEAYEYVDKSRNGSEKIIVSDSGYPKDLPSGWLWRPYGGPTFSGDHAVNLIPSYRNNPAPAPTVVTGTPTIPLHKHGNSGRTYTFVTGNNPIDGKLGWKPVDLAGIGKSLAFDPVAPVMAVHDLMEHFPGDEYDPHNEYQAQGAMLWLRFEGGFFAGLDVAEAVVGPAFGMLFHHITKQKLVTKEYDGKPEDADPFKHMKQNTAFTLLDLISRAKRYSESQFRYDGNGATRVLESLQRSIPWIVRGYIRAGERYKGLDKERLVRLYKSTVKQVESVTKGAELKLTMTYEKYESKVELNTPITVA